MKTINFRNTPNFEELEAAGIVMTCDENMNYVISDEDYDRMEDEFPAAFGDCYELTYDVVFHDETSDNNKGWSETYEYCKNYIEQYNGTGESYFADYKGGTVAIFCNETEEEVYYEIVK